MIRIEYFQIALKERVWPQLNVVITTLMLGFNIRYLRLCMGEITGHCFIRSMTSKRNIITLPFTTQPNLKIFGTIENYQGMRLKQKNHNELPPFNKYLNVAEYQERKCLIRSKVMTSW